MAENDERMFHFQLVPHRNVLITLEDKCKGTNELLDKWGLRGNLKCHTFFYNGHFQSYQKIAFVKDFFKDPIVNETLQVYTMIVISVMMNDLSSSGSERWFDGWMDVT
jgi:hypothetical protein